MTVAGGIAHGIGVLGWDAAVCAPGPGIIGSGSRFGHGAVAAADALNLADAIGATALLVPRLSDTDPRERHRGVSHHTRTVASLVLSPAVVAWPEERSPEELGRLTLQAGRADLEGFSRSGLPSTTMGRSLDEDPSFFAAALAGGSVLAAMAAS
jgi:hypothetical protein